MKHLRDIVAGTQISTCCGLVFKGTDRYTKTTRKSSGVECRKCMEIYELTGGNRRELRRLHRERMHT